MENSELLLEVLGPKEFAKHVATVEVAREAVKQNNINIINKLFPS